MDIQQLQEIQKAYRSKKVLGEQAQKTLDACKRGMTDDAYAFSEGLTKYLNENFKRKWIRWKNPLNPEVEFFKFAICFEQSGRNVSVLCSQELDVSYKGDVPRGKAFPLFGMLPDDYGLQGLFPYGFQHGTRGRKKD